MAATASVTSVCCSHIISYTSYACNVLQVTVEYLRDGGHLIPQHVHTVLISAQHSPDISQQELHDELMKHVIQPVIPAQLLTEKTEYYLNPSSR
jgi:S-adenosylmethionine synthetase